MTWFIVMLAVTAGFAGGMALVGGRGRRRNLPGQPGAGSGTAPDEGVPFQRTRWDRLAAWLNLAVLPVSAAAFTRLAVCGAVLLALLLTLLFNGVVALAAVALGVWVVRRWLLQRIARRGRFVAEELPTFLRLLAGCLRSGFSLLQAFELIVAEGPPLLAVEVRTIIHEVNLGSPLDTALQRFATRMNHDDIDLVVSALLIGREVGGHLSESMTAMAETITERVHLRRRIRALTAQARLSGMTVSLLPFGLMAIMSAINPEYTLVLIRDPLGWAVIVVGLTSQLVGAWLIRRIIRAGEDLLL